MKCSQCYGHGEYLDDFGWAEGMRKCSYCKGTGIVPRHHYRKIYGPDDRGVVYVPERCGNCMEAKEAPCHDMTELVELESILRRFG